jgi:hypothetical protein
VTQAAPDPVCSVFDSEPDQTILTANHYDIPADATRRQLMITNLSATNTVRVRDTAGTTDEGQPLAPNSTLVLETSGAVRVRNNSGASVTIAIAHLENP